MVTQNKGDKKIDEWAERYGKHMQGQDKEVRYWIRSFTENMLLMSMLHQIDIFVD